jgi:hypothetical protein
MFYDKLIEKMLPFMTEQGFEAKDGGFAGNEKEVKVVYNQAKKMYELYFKNGEEEKLISAYLFDETQNEKDIESVAIDFIDTLKTSFGVKRQRVAVNNVELPDELGGEKVGVGGLTQKLLAIFPQYKETYKEHVAKYGKLLMTEFCHEYFIPSVKELVRSGNKRQIKKFYDAMRDMFIAADSETVPYIVGILSAAVYGDNELLAAFKEITADCPSLYAQVINFSANMKRNKKLRSVL